MKELVEADDFWHEASEHRDWRESWYFNWVDLENAIMTLWGVNPARATSSFRSWRIPSPADTPWVARVSHTLAGPRQTSPRTAGPFQGTPPAREPGNGVTSPCRQASVIAHPVAGEPPSGAASTPVARGHRSLLALTRGHI